MKQAFFITGTDTEVGKTLIGSALLHAANQAGLKTAAIKPVAAGCERTAEGLRNADALLLQAAMSATLPYQQVNPVALEPAIAPHIAAREAGQRLSVSRLAGFCRGVMAQGADITVIEGAGGWRVPLNERESFADLARELQVPAILVIGMKLGCINHALLSAEAISRDGVALAGWVANSVAGEMDRYADNLATLKQRIAASLLAEVPPLSAALPEAAARYFNIDMLR